MKNRLIAWLLTAALVLALLTSGPLTGAALAAEEPDYTSVEVTEDSFERVMNLAYRLYDENQQPGTGGGFTWDSEGKKRSWTYYNGIMMDAFLMLDSENFEFYVNTFYNNNVTNQGQVNRAGAADNYYRENELDSIPPTRALFDLLWSDLVSDTEKGNYKRMIDYVYSVMQRYETVDGTCGNFRHKMNNANWATYQLALDGMYMAQPFFMEIANALDDGILTLEDFTFYTGSDSIPEDTDEIYSAVFDRMYWVGNSLYDDGTGLYNHAWGPDAGSNGQYWLRAVGWYAAALADVISMLPESFAEERAMLIEIETRLFDGMIAHQDRETGMWYNVINYGPELAGPESMNELESSGTALMAYAMMRSYAEGYVERRYGAAGLRAFNGTAALKLDDEGLHDVYQSSVVETYPEGYLSKPYVTNDAKGVGPMFMAAAWARQAADLYNQPAAVPLCAVDGDTNEALPGVTAQVLGPDGSVAAEWNSTTEPRPVEGILPGVEYTIHVISAPAGYALPEDAVFSLNEATLQIILNGDPIDDGVIEIQLFQTHLSIVAEIIPEGGGTVTSDPADPAADELVTLTAEPAQGYVLKSLTVTDEAGNEIFLDDGQFYMPEGSVTVTAEFEKTRLLVQALDSENEAPLAGAILQILDDDNAVVEEWTSGEEAHVITGLAIGRTYTLRVLQPAEGYLPAGDVPIELDEGGSLSVNVAMIKAEAALEVELTAAPEDGVNAGDEITFTATVRNAGNVALEDVIIESSLADFSSGFFALDPGEEIPVSFTYVVTEADVYAGEIACTATVTGTAVRGEDPEDAEAQVTVTTAGACPIIGHDWGEWEETTEPGCTEEGEETRVCARCGETETRPVAALGHHYEDVVNDPTCTEGGCTVHTCSRCGDSYEDDYTDALGHEWGEWTITVPPTETEPGEETRVCSNCGATETRSVNLFPDDPITITQEPADASAPLGETVVVTVAAEGEGLSYQWYFRDAGAENWITSIYTDDTYTLIMKGTRSGREVYCVVTDAEGNSVTTRTATLSLELPDDYVYPSITQDAADSFVGPGEMPSVTVAATGYGDLTCRWYYRNAGTEKWNVSSIKTETYACTMSLNRHGRQIYCVVSDAYGNRIESRIATIGFDIPAGYEGPTITQQPSDSFVADVGGMTDVTVAATGEGELSYQWYYRDAGSEKWIRSSLQGESYAVYMKITRDGRQVYCEVSDAYGFITASEPATIGYDYPEGYEKPSFTAQSGDVTVEPGEMAIATVEAAGNGDLTFQWYFRNAGAEKWSKSIYTDRSYTLSMRADRDGREVYCVVTDRYGAKAESEPVTLRMNVPEGYKLPVILTEPQDASAPNGETAVVTVKATGDSELSYQWYYRSAGAKKWSKSIYTGETYTLTMTEARDGREVYCVVTDRYGYTVSTRIATLSLTP